MNRSISVAGIDRCRQDYWNEAAETYEQDFAVTLIGRLQRSAVWRDLDRVFHPPQRILELNCGTGIDAVHLCKRGLQVVACDISPRMIDLAIQRAQSAGCSERLGFHTLATEEIGALAGEGPFDGVFSNFSGLNCVEDLTAVRRSLSPLINPGSPMLLCMLGRFVPWEIAWFMAHGNWNAASRRVRRSKAGCVPKTSVKVHYPSVSEIARAFAPDFTMRRWRGVGLTLPPSYLEHWAQRFSRLTSVLAGIDHLIGDLPVLRNMANFAVLEFERMRPGENL
jgi:2-polyprenyl-3-methyl-5-hydroxy-6-metoxy-1,4-benzoquinol methylase